MIKCIYMYTKVVNFLQIIDIYNINNLYIFENRMFNNLEMYFTFKKKYRDKCVLTT